MNKDLLYVGACALLGRLSARPQSEEDRACIKRALDDCVEAFPGRFEVVNAGGGWSLEPIFLEKTNG